MISEDFCNWMTATTNLSNFSINKYCRAVYTISKEMNDKGVIKKEIYSMNIAELDIYIPLILNDTDFINKNNRGNYMYSNALKQFRSFVSSQFDSKDAYNMIIDSIYTDKRITVTEKQAIVNSRIGQGIFRDSLMSKYNSTCIVTGINIEKALIASHIKPWAASNNDERISQENGLLLSATFDRLFDGGLISFTDKGKMLISHFIDEKNRNRLGIDSNTVVNLKESHDMIINLEYHRDVVFIK